MADKVEDYVLTSKIVDDIIYRENLGKKLTRHENLWFQNNRNVRKPYLTFAMTDDEFDEYIKCKVDIYYFIEKYCKIKREDGTVGQMTLRDYQREIVDLYTNNPRSILMASRQTGKTVSAALVILHFVLFNDDKGVMIVANKGKTVKEIIKKIKDIYKLLPFFVKKGAINWNETQIAFENNSRIQTENRTKDPSIGFTIDLLYLDEFAHIPNNYVEDYYSAVVPIVSSVNNSRIIITSTPKGFNMFHNLLRDAEREDGDPLKNPYKAMRVYWWQVEGRQDTEVRIVDARLKKYSLSKSTVLRELREKEGLVFYKKHKGTEIVDCVKYNVEDQSTHIDTIRKIRVNGIPLPELAVISNWREQEIRLLNGNEEKFMQEYELHFASGEGLLFNKETMDSLRNRELPFAAIDIPHFDRKFTLPYRDYLKFVKDTPELFDRNKVMDYYIFISVDLAEGLAKDYTVFNIFRLMIRDDDDLKKHKYENMYDLFKLEQIGLFRNNVYSIREAAHMLYLIAFEFFDPEKVKVVLEYNTYGAEFLAHLPHVFEDDNDYFTGIFVRYKHRNEMSITAGYREDPRIGLRLSRDKHLIVDKEFQGAIKKRKMILHSEINILEIAGFAKHETISGSVTYKAEAGHDDVVMTTVLLSTVFDNVGYKNMIDMYVNNELDGDALKFVEEISENRGLPKMDDFMGAYKKVYSRRGPPQNLLGSPFRK